MFKPTRNINKFYISIFLIILVVISIENVYSQSKTIEINLNYKDVTYVFDEIIRFEKWGIIVKDDTLNRTILYKIIKTIKVYDSTYVNMISGYVSNLEINFENGVYIIDFENAEIPELKPLESRELIDYKYWTFSIRLSASGFDRMETLEGGFAFTIWSLSKLYHRVTVSTGYPYSPDTSYYVLSLNYGLGLNISKEPIEFSIWANYSNKFLSWNYSEYSGDNLYDVFSLEGNVTKRYKGVFPYVGLRYYLDNIKIKGKRNKIIFLFGIKIPI